MYVEAGCSVEDGLKDYIKTNYIAIGDLDTNTLLDEKSVVDEDRRVIIIRKETIIEIELEKHSVLASSVDEAEVALAISKLSGIEKGSIFVEIKVDEEDYILKLIVVLKDADLSQDVIDAIKKCVKNQ